MARGQIRGDTTGRLKLIFHRETLKVLGVHIIGEGAAELLGHREDIPPLAAPLETVREDRQTPGATACPVEIEEVAIGGVDPLARVDSLEAVMREGGSDGLEMPAGEQQRRTIGRWGDDRH